MVTYPQDEGEHLFYVVGESITGAHSYKPVNLTVQCVPASQTVTLSDDSILIVDMIKNIGVSTLLDIDQIEALFQVSDQERCQIQTYSLHNAAGALVVSTDSLFT